MSESNTAPASPEERKFLSLWEKLTPQQQEAILRFMEVMLKK